MVFPSFVFYSVALQLFCGTVALSFYLRDVTLDSDIKKAEVITSENGEKIAWSVYRNNINESGWAFLEVYTSGNFENDIQAYSAGWIEGQVTRDLIKMQWHNMFGNGYCSEKNSIFCDRLKAYLKENLKWIQSKIETHDDPYWEQVKLFYYQTAGLIDGYNNVTGKPRFDIDITTLFLMQIDGDLDDLEAALGNDNNVKKPFGNGHCSALVKVLPGNEDLFVAQDTWTEYQQMLRILKKYVFPFYMTSAHKQFVPVQGMTFSSYPGFLTSGDDFYVLSNGMVTMETTIGNSNADLWKYVHPDESVLEGIRSVVANRLASTAGEWSNLFVMYNSGTYNNQWMVVDYNKFTPGQELEQGLFYVVEQIPGMTVSQDLTEVLKEKSYFGSYNIAYFPEIFNSSGGPAAVKKFGDWFTYDHSPRANIFRRDHVKVKDTTSMTKLMRYNNFEKDPLSRCNCTPPYSGENGISARSDLNPINGTYPFGALGHRAHGGIDMKLTTSHLRQTLDFIAVGGPTYDDLPPFQWSTSDFDKKLSHVGHPDLWKFDPIQTMWGTAQLFKEVEN